MMAVAPFALFVRDREHSLESASSPHAGVDAADRFVGVQGTNG
jgi:hypothetical protein